MEIDGEAFVDRRRIDRWLATVPYHDVGNEDLDKLSIRSGENDFDLESVEMWDTRSAIAEGPWRRRIDKWNTIRLAAVLPANELGY